MKCFHCPSKNKRQKHIEAMIYRLCDFGDSTYNLNALTLTEKILTVLYKEKEVMEERMKLYILVPLVAPFFLLFEQGALHFGFVSGPANYVVAPTLRFNWTELKRVLRSDAQQVAGEVQTPNRYPPLPSLEPQLKQRLTRQVPM